MKHSFQVNGRTYKFRFHKEGPVIKCRMFIVDGTEENWIETGIATCSPSERFNVHKGRKISLGRTLNLIIPDKEVRKQVWSTILESKDLTRNTGIGW